jgi:type IX secretion system PorP/SprF family membrane protein
MKKLLLFAAFVFCTIVSEAQVDPLYAQYLNNPLLLNPAYSGISNNFSAAASYRKQWAGFDGSPSTFNVNAHSSFNNNKMGLGLIVLSDQIGANANTEVQATYAYKLDLGGKFLSFGLQAGMVNFKSSNGDLNPYDPSDPTFAGTFNFTKPSFGAGAILHSDKYFVGLSVPRMLKSNVSIADVETELYSQHFYLLGAYNIFLNEHFRLKPSVLLKGVKGARLSTDLNFALNIDERYTAGVFARNFNTYGLLAQMKLNDTYRFGYALEVPSNKSVGTRFVSHEFMIGMNLSLFDFHDKVSVSTF